MCCMHCRITRFATFPDFLFLHMQKFAVGNDWVERKLGIKLVTSSLSIISVVFVSGDI